MAAAGLAEIHRVSLDQVIETMRATGADMSTKYKETSNGSRTADLIAELQNRIAVDGPVLESGKNHPAVAEIRQQRITLARLLVALQVPAGDEDAKSGQRRRRRGVYQFGGRDAS